jgi:uncharacterized membrane protein
MPPAAVDARNSSQLSSSLARVRAWVAGRERWVALGVAILYFVAYATLAVLRHRSYHSLGFDLGLFDQAFWNTTQGRPFESTMSQAQPLPHTLFSDHFSPIFWLIVPFYFAYPHPETLVVIQTFCVALGAWPVYLLARLKLAPGYGLAWVVAYFLFLPVAYIDLFDFHEIALAIAPLGFALYFLEAGHRARFVASLAIAFLVKEEIGLVGIGFGAYILLGKRDRALGLGVVAASAAAFAAIIGFVIPFFAGGHSYPYFAQRYRDVGGSPLGIVRTLVTRPQRIAASLLQSQKVFFVVGIFGPVLGLSALAGWAGLLVLPTLGYLLLSNYAPQYQFTSQYPAPLVPLVLGTAILAMSRLPARRWLPLMTAVLVSSLVFSWAFGYLPFSRKFDFSEFQTEPRYASFIPQLKAIPAGASVSGQYAFSSQLAERPRIYDYRFEGVQNADWVVLDFAGSRRNIEVFDEQVAQVEAQGYVEVASGYGLALLRKQ